jgi:dienelactone hydrolase
MKQFQLLLLIPLVSLSVFTSCKSGDNKKEAETKEPVLKEASVTYTIDGLKDSLVLDGYIVYDENMKGKRPGVLVVHEWWGLNDYAKMRARELAKLGYTAMALDMYGNGKRSDNPEGAGALATPFYANPAMAKERFDVAMKTLAAFEQTDPAKIGAIGYCFGGAQVINMAKMGSPLKGVVSFHGNLNVVPTNKDLLKAEILVCHGNTDPFVPEAEVALFKKQMDSIGAKYLFKGYDSASHAFTNPEATAIGEKFKIPIKYNAAADTASWNEMKQFFNRVFQ